MAPPLSVKPLIEAQGLADTAVRQGAGAVDVELMQALALVAIANELNALRRTLDALTLDTSSTEDARRLNVRGTAG